MRAHSIVARYVVHVRTPMPPAEAFAYMADLTNFAEWDPGVDRVEQVEGDGAGPGAVFDVAVKLPGRTMTLRYDTVAFDDTSHTMTAFAQNAVMTSEDTIAVEADGNGSIVTYDAVLKLKGLLGLSDPLLGLTFNQIGDRAAAGLVKTLAGERVAG
jgi:carbon monoxide dehydrogenase subunit G